MKYIRNSIQQLSTYIVPQDKNLVKLNQNESPYDLPESLKETIFQRMKNSDWHRYPPRIDHGFLTALATYTNYPKQGIMIGNGSNEVIQAIYTAVCRPRDKIVLISPSFAIFSRLAQIMDLEIIKVPMQDDFDFDVPTIIKKAAKARLVVLASPNNPTGRALSLDALEKIASSTRGILVIDEAYFEFHNATAQKLLADHNNLIITRTFSKAFGLAGLRLGYLLAQPKLSQEIEKARLPFSVGMFQQIAGEVVLQHKVILENIISKIIDQRKSIYQTLRIIPNIIPIPSQANFILFQVSNSARAMFKALYEQGILVRCFDHEQLKNMLRVTIGKPDENRKFIVCLNKVMQKPRE